MSYAQDERAALCALLDKIGPAAATLCEGWSTVDLAAHLVLREHRPDAGAGILGGPLAGYTRWVQHKLSAGTPFPKLVETIRSGPPRLSVFGLPGMNERVNTVEFFVHHEDVRRAQPGWQPRALSHGLSEELWQRLKMARTVLRKAPVGVELARSDEPRGRPGRTEHPADRQAGHAGRHRHRPACRADALGAWPDRRGAGQARRQRGGRTGAERGQLARLSRGHAPAGR